MWVRFGKITVETDKIELVVKLSENEIMLHMTSGHTHSFVCEGLADPFLNSLEDVEEIKDLPQDTEILNITGMAQDEILCEVAKIRSKKYPTLKEAAKSLGIDVRTLRHHEKKCQS